MSEPCEHKWPVHGLWGTILGLDRCFLCDKLAMEGDFPNLKNRAKEIADEHQRVFDQAHGSSK